MNSGVIPTMSSVSVPVSVQKALRTALTLILGVALSMTVAFIAAPANAETGEALPGTVAFDGPGYLGGVGEDAVGPSSMAITSTGTFAYVNDHAGNAVREVNLSTGATTRSWTISSPTSLAIDPAANAFVIVAHGSAANYSRILLSDGVVSTHSLTTGSDPYYVLIDATGTHAYFAERLAKRIEKIQLSNNTVVGTLTLTSEPSALAITPDGASLYAASFSGKSVSRIATTAMTLIDTYPVATNPVGIAATPDGNQVLITQSLGENFMRINVSTGDVQLSTIPLTQRSLSLAIDPYSAFAYVGSYGREVVKVDLRTGASTPFTAFPGNLNPETTAIAFPTSGGQVAKYAYLAVVSTPTIAKISISPYAPSPVTGTRGNALANLSWTVPTYPGADPITDYRIEYSNVDSTNDSDWTAFPHAASTATSIAVTGLTNGTPYYFRVAAISAAGTGLYANLVGTLTPATVPGAPTSVSATPANGQLTLNWAAPTSNGGEAITDYLVETSTDNTNWTVVAHSPSTATSLVATGLINGTPYYFRVAAINAVGTSAYGTGGPSSPTDSGGGGGTPTVPELEATITESQSEPVISSVPSASTPPTVVITPSIASARVIYRQRSDARWEVVPRFRKAAKAIPQKALFTVVRSPIAGQSKNIPAAVSRGKALAAAHAGLAHTSVLKGKLWRGRARIIVNW